MEGGGGWKGQGVGGTGEGGRLRPHGEEGGSGRVCGVGG